MKPNDRIWLSRGEYLPAGEVTKVFEEDGEVIFLDNNSRRHRGYRPTIVYESSGEVTYERGQDDHRPPIERVTFCKPPQPKLPAAVKSVFEKEWKARGVATSPFELAGKINHIINDGEKRKRMALEFIRMKKYQAFVESMNEPVRDYRPEVLDLLSLTVILIGALRGLKYSHA